MFKKYLIFSIPLTFSLVYCLENKADISFDDIIITGQQQIYHGKSELKTYTKAGSYSYLDQTQIQRYRGSSVGDFLSGIPGVIVGNKRNSGGISVNIRGLQNEDRVLVKIDDSFQSTPTYQGYSGSSTRTFLDPDLISTAQIEKGPSFSYDGVGAIGGVVRMSTLKSEDILPNNSDKDWGFRFRVGTMSNTTDRPPLYTRGGYQKYGVSECLQNSSGLCKPISHEPDSKYQSSNLFNNLFKSYNTSLAFTKQWETGDIVLGFARKKQGNYFVGRHGQTPEILKIEEDDESYNTIYDDNGNKLYRAYIYDFSDDEEDHLRLTKAIFNEKTGYTYFRAGEEALNTWQDNKSFLTKLNLYNDFHAFNITYSRYKSRFGELMPYISEVTRSTEMGTGSIEGDGSEVQANGVSVKYNYHPDDPYINFTISSYLTKVDYANYTRMLGRAGYEKGASAYILENIRKGIQAYNTSTIDLFNKPLKLTYGVSYTTQRLRQPSDAFSRIIGKGLAKDDKEADLVIGNLNKRDAKREEKSAFIHANYPILKWLTVDFGGRYVKTKTTDYTKLYIPKSKILNEKDYSKKEWRKICEKHVPVPPSYQSNPYYYWHDLGYCRFQIFVDINDETEPVKNSDFQPMAMITISPIDEWQIWLKYAKASRPASLFQASRGAGMTKNELQSQSPRPEKIQSIEIGTNFLANDILSKDDVFGIKFIYFQNNIDDYLTRRTMPSKIAKGERFLNTINIESAKYEGFEAQAYYDMGNFYTGANLTYYLNTKFCLYPDQMDKNGKRCFKGGLNGSNISNTLPPKYIATANIGARFFNKKLDVGARYSYYGKRIVSIFDLDNNEGGNTNSASWDKYAIIDLYANYKATNNLTLSLGIDNLTNKYYLDANNMSLSPAPGRTLQLNLDYRF